MAGLENDTGNRKGLARKGESGHADDIYTNKMLNISDPEGKLEAEINKLAIRMSRARAAGDDARYLTLRTRLADKCMRFFYVVGKDVSQYDGQGTHFGGFSQINGVFIDSLMEGISRYSHTKESPFVSSFRARFKSRTIDAARKAKREDEHYGGGKGKAPISLQAPVRRNDDGTTTLDNYVGEEEDFSYLFEDSDWAEEDARETMSADEAINESDVRVEGLFPDERIDRAEAAENALVLRILSLVVGFYGKSGKAASETRKLYTRLFFTESLTRATKLMVEGELGQLIRNEKALFGASEIPFQDSYTLERCRSIIELWRCGFIEGIRDLKPLLNDAGTRLSKEADYGWRIPAKVYIAYLELLGRPASDALVSGQRRKYAELLHSLTAK